MCIRDSVTAVRDFNLEIDDREFIVLVGPSGCGKSTTLRMIAVSYTHLDVYKRQVLLRAGRSLHNFS